MSKQYYRIIFACFVQMFLCSATFFSISGVFIVPVSTDLGIGHGQFTLYMSIQCITMAVGVIFAPKLLNRYRFKKLNAASVFLGGVGFAAMGLARNPAWLYISGVVIGLGCVISSYLFLGVILPRWFKQHLGAALATAGLGMSLGGAVLNPICAKLVLIDGLLGFSSGWRGTYIIMGGLILIICLPVSLLFIEDYPEKVGLIRYGENVASDEETVPTVRRGVMKERAVSSRPFFLLLIMITVWTFACQILVYLPPYVTELLSKGFLNGKESLIGFISSVSMAGGIIGIYAIGLANDHFGGHGGAVFAGVCGSLGCFLLLIGAEETAVLLAGAFLFGCFYAIADIQLPAMVTTLFGEINYEEIYSVAARISPWFGAVSSALWGYLYDFCGSYRPMLFIGTGLCITTMVTGISAVYLSRKFFNA